MEWSWPDSVSSNRQRVMEELIQGRDLASELRRVLDHKSSAVKGEVGSAEGLVNKILGSFANTLFILNGKRSDQELVSHQIQGNSGGGGDSSSWYDHAAVKSEDSEESCKSTSTFKDRRGSYKRRKASHSWTRTTHALTDDGHAWRKYGQKVILNTKHPRNYFRCTHKFDQACQATKHVQKLQDDPPLVQTTYYGNHTCRDYLKASELVLDCSSPRDSSKLISFDNAKYLITNKQEHPFFSSDVASVKKETNIKEEKLPASSYDHHVATHDHHQNRSSSCDDYFVSPDLPAFESSGPLSGFSSSIDQYDHDDVISGFMAGPNYDHFDDQVLKMLNF